MKTKTKKDRITVAPGPDLATENPLSAFLSLFPPSMGDGRRARSRDTWFFDLLKTDEAKKNK